MKRPKYLSLLINIDHIATLRNARGGSTPDPVRAAEVCIAAGAQGVVCHLREDRRHIRDDDVRRLRTKVRTRLDLEMAATPEIVGIALRTKPDLVTLVPERRKELTTEGGLDLPRSHASLRRVIQRFRDAGIRVSLFVDPYERHMRIARDLGAHIVELHTGAYASAASSVGRRRQLDRLRTAASSAAAMGLAIHAGHGLDYHNTGAVVRIPHMHELSIGFAIVSRALDVGLYRAVAEMVSIVRSNSRHTYDLITKKESVT